MSARLEADCVGGPTRRWAWGGGLGNSMDLAHVQGLRQKAIGNTCIRINTTSVLIAIDT